MQKVFKVYTGKSNRCMCGCSGKYRYASDELAYGSKWRGYKVRAEEVSDRSVKMVTKQVLNSPDVQYEGDYAFVDDGNRIKVVYFKEEVDAAA